MLKLTKSNFTKSNMAGMLNALDCCTDRMRAPMCVQDTSIEAFYFLVKFLKIGTWMEGQQCG
jgi:hypothetical protein